MKRLTIVVTSAVFTLMAGCVLTSVHPFYTSKEVVLNG